MSNHRFAKLTLEIMERPLDADSCEYLVLCRRSTSDQDSAEVWLSRHKTLFSAFAILGIVLEKQTDICGQFFVTNTGLAPPKESPAKPSSNPLLSEDSGIA